MTVGECLGDPKKNWYRKPGAGAAFDPGSTATTAKSATTSKMSTAPAESATTNVAKVARHLHAHERRWA